MYWQDEGYLLSKNNFNENSIIIEAITLDHGKYSGIVYGGSSRKLKKDLQIGNKLLLNLKSKNDNKMGYFNLELLKPISPMFFDDKKRSICILSSSQILKILLPERQINKKIYLSFDSLINNLKGKNATYNSLKIIEIYKGIANEFSEAVALNVAAGLIVSGKENDFKDAFKKATKHLKSGNVFQYLSKVQST